MGISIVEQYFRRDGWSIWGGPPGSVQDVIALLSTMWFDLVGFSVNSVPEPAKLAFDISMIRKAARNRSLVVMAGGYCFNQNPDLAAIVGADATAADGAEAISRCADMVHRPALTS